MPIGTPTEAWHSNMAQMASHTPNTPVQAYPSPASSLSSSYHSPKQQRLQMPVAQGSPSVATPAVAEESPWSEHKTDDGRIFYYNKVTQQSSWEKPDEFKTELELILAKTPWQQFTTPEGKVYYFNKETKQSSWTLPKELNDLQREAQNELSAKEQASAAAAEPTTPSKSVDADGDPAGMERKQAVETFCSLLRDKKISSNASWEQTMKLIQNDPRYRVLKKLHDKKQVFNSYKNQRARDEKEELRQRTKKAKEDLENWLQNHEQVTSVTRYRKLELLFKDEKIWNAVPDAERREIFKDVMYYLEKKEREEAKAQRKRNIKALADILDNMPGVNSSTTWADAQKLLLEIPAFINDPEIQSMDKEDALIVFEEHIRQLEKDERDEEQNAVFMKRRQERKARDKFKQFLEELRRGGKLRADSRWCDLYPIISADQRYEDMISLYGSTPLDLFKFYLTDLQKQMEEDRRLIKDIMKDRGFKFSLKTEFAEFEQFVKESAKSATIDPESLRSTFDSLVAKAEAKEKSRTKDERKMRKATEGAFTSMLRSMGRSILPDSTWEEVRPQIEDQSAFKQVGREEERVQLFEQYVQALQVACGHHHHGHSKKRRRKDRKVKKARVESDISSDSDKEERVRKRRTKVESDSEEESYKKRRRRRSLLSSDNDEQRQSLKRKEPSVGSSNLSYVASEAESGELSDSDLEKTRQRILKQLKKHY
uniref:WW domain-containing protein n=1 Tax=Trichuris muris TaxID=70415 RepID=A0A5S6QKE0_TRIMR